MKFISAGHDSKSDPGAVYFGVKEADLTIEQERLVGEALLRKGFEYKTDKDDEKLGEYLKRIEPGNASVVADLHFNASVKKTATGIEVVVPDNPSKEELYIAGKLCAAGARILGITNRGVKTESQSARGKLALMREAGQNFIIETCFMSNATDMTRYRKYKGPLAEAYAEIFCEADDLIK